MTLHDITELPDEGIILSDGTRLSARIWRPTDATDNPVPAILEYLPYRKRDGTCARDALTHPYFAARGYACIRVDMRGNGDSDGLMLDEYAPQEQADALEVIDWLAAQPWCDGNVGMMGISWGGFNGLQVAALQPDPLKAIITLCSTVDRFADDIHYKGGCLLNENLGWGATMWSYSSRPPDPALVGDKWREMWLERLEAEPFLPSVWLRHQARDAYWQHGSVCEDYSAIKAATLAVGGWGDAYKNAVPALVENLSAPAKGIIGPWVHKYPHFAVPEPRIGFLQEALRWWDRWLKGIDTGVEDDPDLRYYLMDGVRPAAWYEERPGRWITMSKDQADVSELRLPLGRDRTLGDGGADLSEQITSPADTGADAGEYCAIWLGPEMPGDQRHDDALSVCFDSAPMPDDTDIVGAPRIRLRLQSDQPQGQIAVRLCHVHPDGASTRITYGVLNLAHRKGSAKPKPVPVGKEFGVTLSLDQIAYRIPAGHHLRVSISNAYWPLIWPAPGKTQLTLTRGFLDLPVRHTATGDECTFEPPEAAEPWRIRSLREATNSRITETDHATGISTLRITDDFGETEDLEHGLTTGGIAREAWSIHPDDPLSARGETHWTQTLERGDWSVRTETFAQMWSDATHFHLTARIEAFAGDELVYARDEEESIPRHCL
ncbi:CocE/NonD family hydrolase [Aliiroseovarius subalbicans]|uniref:CocE/NonD family hydrolase n=1 Tax=Aliiroseovarius subalbicans TaxID=2925840 RepID=UPI001F55F5BC|nr:CocE/NonD family hydrolase [Aliiroseovarius subalbicans]MCI2400000.1 CocE/NonD family hydrolase [Aliiroseovarius subalbicans]